MRWLLLKDLQILRRSPLLVALLVIYPIVIAVLFGVALSAGPSKPRVAFANLVPPGDATVQLGGQTLDASTYASRLFKDVDPIRVKTRAEAIEKVKSGDALAALIIPADTGKRLRDTLGLGGGPRPTVEVLYNAEDPVKRRFVESTIRAQLAQANAALSDVVLKEAASYIDIVVKGGKVSIPFLGSVDILGLRKAQTIVDGAAATLPQDSSARVALEQVSRFAKLAADNLDVSKPILATIGTPVRGQADRHQRLAHAAGRVRRGRGDRRQPDVRHAPAGRRPARARARGERVRPARPRPRRQVRAARREGAAGGAVRVRRDAG